MGSKTSTKRKPGDLTAQQRLFAHEVVRQHGNAAAAYRETYPNASPATAETSGPALLRKPQVREYVSRLQEKQLARIDSSAERVKAELARLAFVDLGEAYDANGRLKPIHEIPEDTRRAIAGLKVFEEFEGVGADRVQVGEVRELKLFSKVDALRMLAQHHRLLADVVEHRGTINVVDPYAVPAEGAPPAPGSPPSRSASVTAAAGESGEGRK